jgi:hypothetical protein
VESNNISEKITQNLGELYYRVLRLDNGPESIYVENKEEIDADERGPFILHSEVEKLIKEVMDKQAR